MTTAIEPPPGAPSSGADGSLPRPASPPTTSVLIAAMASAGAGLAHAAAAGSHSGDATLMWLFALTAAAQLAWAGAMVLRSSRTLTLVGIVVNGGAVLAWVASRTVGLFGPLAGVESVGTQDLLAASLGAIAVVAAAFALRSSPSPQPARGAVVALAGALVLALAVPAMAAQHTHGASHEHGHGHDEVAASTSSGDDHASGNHGSGDGHASGDHASSGVASGVTGPIVSVDDPRLTHQQRRAATALLDQTREALTRFPDEAAVVAAGYRSIGDGRRVGGFEHFVHAGLMRDGRELDPDAIESIVLQRRADGSKAVMSAMYILEPGKTMADAPDIAGELTPWHDHQNLCWDESGTRLAGVVVDGRCVPGGTFRPTPPMIHVWVDDPRCGPFTGIEGHGATTCDHAHAT